MADEKKELLMVTPTMFVDREGNIWDYMDGPPILGHIKCVVCGKPATSRRFSYEEVGDNLCHECARIVVGSEMWNHYDKYHKVARLYNLFEDVLRQCTLEYEMHMPGKKHSWKDTHIEYLVKQIHIVHAKFTIADVENSDEVALEELTDLILVCMMMAQRLFWCQENPTIPM